MIMGDHVRNDRITVCKVKGRLTFSEIREKVMDLCARGPATRVLCDLTQATVADLTNSEIEDIIELISGYVYGTGGGKAAIIANSGVDYGVARIFGTYTELAGLPVKVQVFRTSEIARQWLQEPWRRDNHLETASKR